MSVLVPCYEHWNRILATVIATKRDRREGVINLTRQAPWTPTGLVRLWMEANHKAYEGADYRAAEFNADWADFTAQIRWDAPLLEPLQAAMATHCLLYNCEDGWASEEDARTLMDFFADMIREDPFFGPELAQGWESAYENFYRNASNELSQFYCIG